MTFRARRAAVVAGCVALTAVAAACGPAPWMEEAGRTPSPAPTATPSAPVETEEPDPGDLADGSAQRELTVGAVTATVDYWSDLDMRRWQAGAAKPLSLSLTSTVEPDDGQQIFLQSASLVVVPWAEDSALDPLDTQTDDATVSPGYLVSDPYSYAQTFTIGALPDETTSIEVQIRYDLLVEAAPDSDEYAKQAASDALTIAIAPPAG